MNEEVEAGDPHTAFTYPSTRHEAVVVGEQIGKGASQMEVRKAQVGGKLCVAKILAWHTQDRDTIVAFQNELRVLEILTDQPLNTNVIGYIGYHEVEDTTDLGGDKDCAGVSQHKGQTQDRGEQEGDDEQDTNTKNKKSRMLLLEMGTFSLARLLSTRCEAGGALFPLTTLVQWACQLARGVAFMHERGVLHLDLKPLNVMCDAPTLNELETEKDDEPTADRTPLVMKLIDFDVAHVGLAPAGCEAVGTHNYMCPEMWLERPYGPAADVYSYGMCACVCVCMHVCVCVYMYVCVCVCVCTTQHKAALTLPNPHNQGLILQELVDVGLPDRQWPEHVSLPELERRVVEGVLPVFHHTLPEAYQPFKPIIERCLSLEPNARPAMAEVVCELEKAFSGHCGA